MKFLYIPLMYTFHTRLLGLKSKVAWIFTYIIPTFIAYMYIYGAEINSVLAEMISFGVSVTCIYGAYELGYIYNDAELIKREINPTLRLSNNETEFYEKHKLYIYTLRLMVLFGLLYVLYVVAINTFLSTALSCLAIIVLYVIYNSARSMINIPLYSCLVFFRYFGAVFLFCSISHIFLLWVIYPFVSTIEFAAKDKYKISMLSGLVKNDRYRVLIYFILVALLFTFYVAYGELVLLPLILALYFLLYRTLIFWKAADLRN
ncbi:hypothetical protein [Aeromonas hydrophila]|uniref:hypothetical protein n=1 Tax=Aeromonas hydrophila TaxID=644 RepID=UPI002B45ADF3|nr:hypothetical protein [Aeromonas hydrophila]